MTPNRVYHVHLYEPFQGKSDFYFGSIVAIYETIPTEVLGIKYTSLTAKKLTRYENKKCIINVDDIRRNTRKSKLM